MYYETANNGVIYASEKSGVVLRVLPESLGYPMVGIRKNQVQIQAICKDLVVFDETRNFKTTKEAREFRESMYRQGALDEKMRKKSYK